MVATWAVGPRYYISRRWRSTAESPSSLARIGLRAHLQLTLRRSRYRFRFYTLVHICHNCVRKNPLLTLALLRFSGVAQ